MINLYPSSKLNLFSVLSVILIVGTFSTISSYTPLQASNTTWVRLSSDYPDAVFADVSFLNSTHGWIAGRATSEYSSNAIVLYTEDSGYSWQLQYNHSSQWLTTIDVLNPQTVWINGFGSLFYTLDGGLTWNESVVVGGMRGLTTVKFLNLTYGWTSYDGILYQTLDSGGSWESVSGFTFDDNLLMIQCLSSYNIWATGFSGIYHSMDGGITWEETSNNGGWSLSFVSDTEGWVVDDNRLAHTVDGNEWMELTIPGKSPLTELRITSSYLSDVQFIDEDHGWIVGTEIPVMYTPDGGSNWYEQTVPEGVNSRIKAVDFISTTHGWAVGWNGIIMRTTSGSSLGNRLWYGMTDPLLLSIVAIVVIVPIGVFIIKRYRRGERPDSETKSPQPEI